MPTAEIRPVPAPFCDTCEDRVLYDKDKGWCHTDGDNRPITDPDKDQYNHKPIVMKWLWEYWQWQFMDDDVPPNAVGM